jgi:hypothetical protein
MRLRTKIGLIIASGVLAAVPVIVSTGPAQAAGQICENGGTGLCLNDWNGGGSGNAVKMGQNGFTHQSFGAGQLTAACGHGRVTNTCPFNNTALDSALFDSAIFAVKYTGNGLCVGTSTTGRGAILTTCPDNAGNGGGTGTIMVQRVNQNNCFVQNGATQLTDRYWSDHDATIANLTGSTAVGNQAAMFNNVQFNVACWGTG